MPKVTFRVFDPGLTPRRTKLEMPGWAGAAEPRADGSHEQPWHCIPFTEAARAGVELLYPYPHAMHVTVRDGVPVFEPEVGALDGGAPESGAPDGMEGEDAPPFRSFGRDYYTFQSSIDLKVDGAYAIKVETHPSFYTDTTGTVPIAVPAVLRPWWPMIYFVVFKSPAEGQTHVFRPGAPFIQMSLVPADGAMDLEPMPEAEAAERELQSARIYASRATLAADSQWTSSTRTVFDGTYRRLSGAARSVKER
jgi:hypothetical protein